MLKNRFISLLLCAMWLAPVAARAQSETEDINQLSLEDLLNIKVSVATKTAESVAESASSVTVFSQAEIKRLGVRNLEELLAYAPGFHVMKRTQPGSAYQINLRGIGAGQNEGILFLVNGQRMNDLRSGGATIINNDIAVDNISQVEIIRGPGSALYGSNAFLGVVNIVTVKNKNEAVMTAGSDNVYRAAANFSRTLSNGVQVYGDIAAKTEDGQEIEATDKYGSADSETDPTTGRDFLFGAKSEHYSVDFRHMDRHRELPVALGTYDKNSFDESTQDSVTAKYNRKLSDNLSTELTLGYKLDEWNGFYKVMPIGVLGGGNPAMVYRGGLILQTDSKSVGMDFRYTPPIENNELLAGISYSREDIGKIISLANYTPSSVVDYLYTGGVSPLIPTASGDIEEFTGSESFNSGDYREVMGVYLQDTHKFSGGFKAVVGARFDDYSDFGSSTNPRASLVWTSPWQGVFKAIYGEAFRAPSFNELYDRNHPVSQGNPNLKAEKIKTTELAYVHSWDKGEASLTYYQSEISDKIEALPPSATPGLFANASEAKPKGIEAHTRFGVGNNATITAQYSKVLDDAANLVAESTASLIFNYGRDKWNYNVSGVYTPEIEYTAATPSKFKAETIYNASVVYNFGSGVKVQGTVINLLDEETFALGELSPVSWQLPNRGREIFASMNFEF